MSGLRFETARGPHSGDDAADAGAASAVLGVDGGRADGLCLHRGGGEESLDEGVHCEYQASDSLVLKAMIRKNKREARSGAGAALAQLSRFIFGTFDGDLTSNDRLTSTILLHRLVDGSYLRRINAAGLPFFANSLSLSWDEYRGEEGISRHATISTGGRRGSLYAPEPMLVE
ncbi:hypothetical protein BV25DRAFT_1837240 [Artomyces pyxidatus]|uniref:Uncharacterized protein n=1 Tax=Artomyces pyxidatus TaxID=48021 RepID=A0ACB8T7F1_9AGAM|nr:hypothetical protein BV25DRAFT_1837240 [Artomyces pyxidatus]